MMVLELTPEETAAVALAVGQEIEGVREELFRQVESGSGESGPGIPSPEAVGYLAALEAAQAKIGPFDGRPPSALLQRHVPYRAGARRARGR